MKVVKKNSEIRNETILIVGKSSEKISQIISNLKTAAAIKKSPHPDLLEIKNEDKSIGIDEIRATTDFISKKPLSALKKLLIIFDAEKLTVEAQNSLLKVLEEPNKSSQIILITSNENKILPTIISRSNIFHAEEIFSPDKNLISFCDKFLKMEIGERYNLLEEEDITSSKEVFIEFLNTLTLILHKDLNSKNIEKIKYIQKIKTDIEGTNVNTKLALDTLIFKI